MKLFARAAFALLSVFIFSQTTVQCQPFPPGEFGIHPSLDSLRCIPNDSSFYTETVQVAIPDTVSGITINWVRVDSIVGFPTGISWVAQVPGGNPPNQLFGGEQGDITISGATTDTVGAYPILIYVTLQTSLFPSPISGELGALLTLLGGGLSGNTLHVCLPCPSIAVTFTISDAACKGGSSGLATASAADGTPPYNYAWSNGDTGATADSLAAGTYWVTVTDSLGCIDSASVAVSEPDFVVVEIIDSSDVSSCLGNDGSATALATGGVGGYSYVWSNTDTGAVVMNLAAGIYRVTAIDSNGCADSASVTINQTSPVVVSILSKTDVSTCGGNDGSATASASGGTMPYAYAWSSGSTDSIANNLPAGNFTVTVTDFSGCTAGTSVTISAPVPGVAGIGSVSHVSCFGGSDGSAAATISGGASPYSYLWSNGSTDSTNAGLAANSYSVTITDNLNCTSTASATINEPSALTLAIDSVRNVLCNGDSNGFVLAVATGGTPPYNFNWSSGSTDSVATSLSAGGYYVTVTDANGCSINDSIQISEPSPLSASVDTVTDVSCFGDDDGSAQAVAAGGTPGYSFVWSSGDSSALAIGLSIGNYTVTVTDQNGCIASSSTSVSQPDEISLSVAVADVSFPGGSDGSVNLTVVGGTAPYDFSWSNTEITEDITDLSAGTYSVTVTDANGCTSTTSADVSEPAPCNLSADVGDIAGTSAPGDSSERAYSILFIPGYTYQWSVTNGEIILGQGTGLVYVQWGGIGPGLLQVIVSDGVCVDTIDLKVFVPVEEIISAGEIRLYPNPASAEFLVSLENNNSSEMKLIITDILGRKQYEGVFSGNKKFSAEDFSAGIHIIEIRAGGTIFRERLLITK